LIFFNNSKNSANFINLKEKYLGILFKIKKIQIKFDINNAIINDKKLDKSFKDVKNKTYKMITLRNKPEAPINECVI
jgi:hypothetical protein